MGLLERRIVIYALIDPRTEQVRYVGQTVDLGTRTRTHFDIRHVGHNLELYQWVYDLHQRGLQPRVEVLEECRDTGQADLQERFWIRKHLCEGCRLLNICDGGSGPVKTKALHVSKAEWLQAAREIKDARRLVQRALVQVANAGGTSKPTAKHLERALQQMSEASSDLEEMICQHFPEWRGEITEALYG